jgi:phosphoribosylanthranilate isomerase
MRPLVKVCGLCRSEDGALAAAEGADLLGFVWHPPSPRHCADLGVAAPFLERAVLVMVADEAEAVLALARHHGFHRVQPHLPVDRRERGARMLREAGLFLLLPWADEPDQAPLPADLYLWEPSPRTTGLAGGSGQGHPMAHPPPGPFLLAGGLSAETLADRLSRLPQVARSYWRGVDAASRLEAAPGRKDPAKVRAFLQSAHALELP